MSESQNIIEARNTSGRLWPFAIVGLLLLNVTVCAITVTAAMRTPMAIEPAYYDKAMTWDADRAAWKSPSSAGLTLDAEIAEGVLRVRAANAQTGEPIALSRVTVEAFSHLRAGDRVRPTIAALGEGVVGARLGASIPGIWEVRVWANAGETPVHAVLTIEATQGDAS